ncbi:C-terminal helicase domain-containing protein [Microcystis aeruginosa]|uniref:C-terminal helicase domain-containing protein n=1 Tax=Microcystis aeruginosa TaxID=1126 RepID=UPI0021CD04F8|nr:C-terminal helicase domain-containing protein [Microcystis aeruginosa]
MPDENTENQEAQMTMPLVRATDIAEYIRYQSCDRRFKLKYKDYELAKKDIPFYELIFSTSLDPVLEVEGRKREDKWEKSLKKEGLVDLTQIEHNSEEDKSTKWNDFVEKLTNLSVGQKAYGREIGINGKLGEFEISGQIDFVIVFWENEQPKLRLVECKASRKDRTYHRVQVALYRMLLRQLINDNPITINGINLKPKNIECVVVRIDENTNKSQDIIKSEALNLDTIEADINRLVASDGVLKRIVETDLTNLDYQLDQKCSDCTLSVHCLAESARQRRLELLAIDSSVVKSLNKVGIQNLDDLAKIYLKGNQAIQLQQDISFTENLELLQLKAKTRRRTLPGVDLDTGTDQVQQLPKYSGNSQLPEHKINGERLIRVYLSVEYDYVENRIGALAAHVTKSEGKLDPKFEQNADDKWQPDPNIKEYLEEGIDENNKRIFKEKELEGKDVIDFQRSAWTGDYKEDNGTEKQLIQRFLLELVDAIDSVAETEQAPIHFYVWSRQEMTQLVEGCSRVSSQLLSHLRELLGCRESLEQLIYSCLSDEVDRRYALGWTGRDLAVVTSLKWFGRRYHWQRKISGKVVSLDQVFFQDVFDFKTNLEIDENNQWAVSNSQNTRIKQDEITGTWEKLLQGNGGLYLVVHDERESKRSNQIEVKIIKNILDAGGEIPDGSTAILTPHRAQRSLLKTQLANYINAVDVIDTVEKVQGGERDNVIVSATASNSSAIGKNVEFILSLNRSNVAFSRVKKRLIVVCSKTLLDYIPKEIEHYEEATLWKALRSECTDTLFNDNIDNHQVQVLTRSLKSRTKEGD